MHVPVICSYGREWVAQSSRLLHLPNRLLQVARSSQEQLSSAQKASLARAREKARQSKLAKLKS